MVTSFRPRSCLSMLALAGFALVATGCSPGGPTVSEDKSKKSDRRESKKPDSDEKYPKLIIPGDSAERRFLDNLAWKQKAIGLLDRMVDEQSSVALISELLVLFEEHDKLNARFRAHPAWEIPKEEKDAIRKKHGETSDAVTTRYIAALSQFDRTTQKLALAMTLSKNHGIDIRRMRTVPKSKGK